jgi:hypothetical protein
MPKRVENEQNLLSESIIIRVSKGMLENLEQIRVSANFQNISQTCRNLLSQAMLSCGKSNNNIANKSSVPNIPKDQSSHLLGKFHHTGAITATNLKLQRKQLRNKITQCFNAFHSISPRRFEKEMQALGIKTSLQWNKDKKLIAVSFIDQIGHLAINGADLGKQYGPKGLSARLSEQTRSKPESRPARKRAARRQKSNKTA